MTTTRLTIGLAAAVLAVGVAAGCGGSSSSSSSSAPPSTQEPATSTPAAGGSSSSGGGGTVVEIDIAQSGFAFVKSTATAPAGVVDAEGDEPQSTPHNISIESDDGSVDQDGPNVSDGGVSQFTVTLKPGSTPTSAPTRPRGCRDEGHAHGDLVARVRPLPAPPPCGPPSSRISRCASTTGIAVSAITNTATAFTSGAVFGSRNWL